MNLILDFISNFSTAADKFTNGWCYYFAVILCDRFYQDNPEIYYDPIANHFVTRINNVYYDANVDIKEFKIENGELIITYDAVKCLSEVNTLIEISINIYDDKVDNNKDIVLNFLFHNYKILLYL